MSDSFYGTADQGGNLWEWNEALISGSFRGLRGGSFLSSYENFLRSSFRSFDEPPFEGFSVGFRVATVPEPNTAALTMVGAVILTLTLRRRS